MDPLDLLSGDAHTFIEEVWGRRIHVHTIPEADLAGLFDIEQADHLITQTALRTPQLRLAQSGSVLAESRFTRQASIAGKPMTGLIDPRKVLDLFSDGATIVFQGLQRYWEPLRQLVRGLETALGHPCQANAYLTPPGSQGFALHSDSHDVFVFQTFGAKEWEVHDDAGAHQVRMVPGTSMYLPTGTPHMARTQATASLHVTIGINRYVWRDLVRRVVDPILAADALAGPLPADLFADPDALAAALRAKLAEVADAVRTSEVEPMLASFERTFGSGRQPVLGGGLLDRLDVTDLTADTPVRRRPGSTCVIRPDGERLRLLLGDRVLTVPARIAGAVDDIAGQSGAFTAADVADHLDTDSAVVLVRRLVREGLLEVVR
ncbi:JmjC domain-containing protein [Propioniciclava soli]|uniref:JmjC domain-containing protein n=1 Tax=Propioniciclava soli TaxID=2775081 RepID=UPI001E54014C|nr:cupin domain-containing protein [Propioniciclava soli]